MPGWKGTARPPKTCPPCSTTPSCTASFRRFRVIICLSSPMAPATYPLTPSLTLLERAGVRLARRSQRSRKQRRLLPANHELNRADHAGLAAQAPDRQQKEQQRSADHDHQIKRQILQRGLTLQRFRRAICQPVGWQRLHHLRCPAVDKRLACRANEEEGDNIDEADHPAKRARCALRLENTARQRA